jgi:hypothetical protein
MKPCTKEDAMLPVATVDLFNQSPKPSIVLDLHRIIEQVVLANPVVFNASQNDRGGPIGLSGSI